MLQLQLVKTAYHEATREVESEVGLNHGTVVLERLVKPWYDKGDRIDCADSYFASVEAALHLKDRGLRFICVVKTATSRFPMKLMQAKVLPSRGDWKSFVHRKDGQVAAMVIVWVDRERRYFISTAASAVERAFYEGTRWRKINSGPKRVTFQIKQPLVAELYYDCCATIDRHNRCRQDDLMLECKFVTMDWSVRVGHSLLGTIIVDSWLLYVRARGELRSMKQRELYKALCLELIDNNFDLVGLRSQTPDDMPLQLTPTSGAGPHATPTKKRKLDKEKKETSARAQRDCIVCKYRTTRVCSECRGEGKGEVFICDSSKQIVCLASHARSTHP
jgi:Transposase IS4